MVLGGFILTILGIIFPKQSHSHWKEDLENTLSKGIERYRDDRRMMDYAHQNVSWVLISQFLKTMKINFKDLVSSNMLV